MVGTLYEMFCTWTTEIVLKFPMKITVERRYNDSASIFRGYTIITVQNQFYILCITVGHSCMGSPSRNSSKYFVPMNSRAKTTRLLQTHRGTMPST